MNTGLFKLIKMAYAILLRPLVVEKIKQSSTQIDDVVLAILDKLFDHDGNDK